MSCTSLLVCTGVVFFLHVFQVMSVDIDGSADSGLPKTWIAKIFYEALVDFNGPRDVGSTACRQQTQMYARHLENDSLWAVQMSDSWIRYPNGILVGTSHHMGVYDECVSVHRPIQGKYCIPSVKLGSSNGVDFTVGKPDQPQSNDHAWREILGFVDHDKQLHRNVVKFGICIPDSCTAADLQVTLQKEFDKHFLPHQVKAQVEVESILCSTDKDEYPYDTGYYLTSSLVGFIFLVCCLSTAYHLIIIIRDNNGKNSEMPETFGSFSLIRNCRDLIKYNKNNELNIFNGLKVVAMLLVLFCHKFLYFVINPITSGIYLEKLADAHFSGRCVGVLYRVSLGPIEKLLNNRLTVPLGRLSYTVYLVNIIVMMMIESKQRTAVTPSSYILVDGWIIGSFRTYFAGTLLYLIIDAPLGLLIKLLLFGK
ncbi:nose resistant to fluoxetine protein 6-like [Metopolophium dirhodum]|uniref:nose resistant to fluoxetine protein 6-like n=1 Tax=Metopolophium dirhodum TaxID=44670 RepID=UPI00298FDEEF|nr:nose resistant to fluoxetine protein 6-like [Metopolophium dirhodum]